MSYHTTRDASFDLEYSFVAVTIGCCPVIKDALKDRLLELTKEVFQGQYGCRILDINVGADFVHVHFDAKPSTALGELARYYIRHTQRPLSLGSTPLSSGKRSCSAMRRKRNGLRPYAKSTV